jgi:NRPS condensation-like uncharacterized protein
MEKALTLTGLHWPLSIVCVLRVEGELPVHVLRKSLDRLQEAHPMLNAGITRNKDFFWFERMNESVQIPLRAEERNDDLQWLSSVHEEINLGFDPFTGPLMRVRFLTSDTPDRKSEIILTLHHAVTDAVSLMGMADQLLTCLGNLLAAEAESSAIRIPHSPLSPLLQEVLPKSFKGPRLWLQIVPFLLRQMNEDRKYRNANRMTAEASVPESSDNELFILCFSEEETDRLVKWSRKKRISLNNLITAAMVLVMNREVYGGNKKMMRIIRFANLRPYLQPPVTPEEDGAFISLMRSVVPVSSLTNIVQLTAHLDQQLLKSGKRGDKFLFALLSSMAMKKTIRDHDSRLGTTALSYAGPVNLNPKYGNIQLNDVHGFITNNRQGPEISGFGKIFSGRLCLDMNFLTFETPKEKATLILEEIRLLILNSINENG